METIAAAPGFSQAKAMQATANTKAFSESQNRPGIFTSFPQGMDLASMRKP
jgi:hypothetical protein